MLGVLFLSIPIYELCIGTLGSVDIFMMNDYFCLIGSVNIVALPQSSSSFFSSLSIATPLQEKPPTNRFLLVLLTPCASLHDLSKV